MTIIPRHDRVLIRRRRAAKRTDGGLYIPDQTADKEPPCEGEVLASGPDCDDLENGDVVLFGKYAGQDIELDGDQLVIVREEDILATRAGEA